MGHFAGTREKKGRRWKKVSQLRKRTVELNIFVPSAKRPSFGSVVNVKGV